MSLFLCFTACIFISLFVYIFNLCFTCFRTFQIFCSKRWTTMEMLSITTISTMPRYNPVKSISFSLSFSKTISCRRPCRKDASDCISLFHCNYISLPTVTNINTISSCPCSTCKLLFSIFPSEQTFLSAHLNRAATTSELLRALPRLRSVPTLSISYINIFR